PEQHQIAHILSTVDKKIEVAERRKATLKELFKTMLHKLMTGEIRVNKVEI
ncbi:MAG: restriction endonuclease subunit S, partial [Methanophagales archaeon]|nr:restriction endonuclease subunit S [Methanophagales archaeon]